VCHLSPVSQLMIMRPDWRARAHRRRNLFVFMAHDTEAVATALPIGNPIDRWMLLAESTHPGLIVGHSAKVE
jgi:hypothetical protein